MYIIPIDTNKYIQYVKKIKIIALYIFNVIIPFLSLLHIVKYYCLSISTSTFTLYLIKL